jgi:DNA-binding MarR family transcriptional regulator
MKHTGAIKHQGQEHNVELWVELMQTHATVTEALGREMERRLGLPLAWHDVLSRLAFAPEGRLRMQDLATSVLISRSGLTRLCDRIEEAGYISRQNCPSDRRGTYAAITEAGRKKFDEAAPLFFKGIEDYFASHLSAREQTTLRSALRKVIAANGGHICWIPPAEAEASGAEAW